MTTSVSPYFGKPPVVRSPFLRGHLQCGSVSYRIVLPVLWHKAGSFARLALVCRLCMPANVLAVRRWLLEPSPLSHLIAEWLCNQFAIHFS